MPLQRAVERDALADMACWGRCHAPIKSRRDVPDQATSDTTKGSQAPRVDSLKESQLAAGRGRSLQRRTSPTRRIRTASLETAAGHQTAIVVLVWPRTGAAGVGSL